MYLLNFIKNNLFIQNFFANFVSIFPPYLEFTLAKYSAIKKAMYITAQEDVRGSYLEFGVFTGSSFNFAMKTNKKIEKIFGNKNCNFFGFDSFKGFGEIKDTDDNPTFKSSLFAVDKNKVLKNIENNSRGQNYKIIDGYFQETIRNKKTSDYNINKARVVMIDCDLKEATKLALDFIKPILQQGTIILFDDFNYFKGDITKGEYGAFEEFKEKNSNIMFRRIYDFGFSGRAFITYKIN